MNESKMVVIKKKVSKKKKEMKERTSKFNEIFNNEDLRGIIMNHKKESKLNDLIEEFKNINEKIKKIDNRTKNGERVSQGVKEYLVLYLNELHTLEEELFINSYNMNRPIKYWRLAKRKKINNIIDKKLEHFCDLKCNHYWIDIEF